MIVDVIVGTLDLFGSALNVNAKLLWVICTQSKANQTCHKGGDIKTTEELHFDCRSKDCSFFGNLSQQLVMVREKTSFIEGEVVCSYKLCSDTSTTVTSPVVVSATRSQRWDG